MKENKLNILITNDDGVFAEGIIELAKELEKYHNICIVAPSSQKSATSHAITITETLIIKEEKIEGISGKIFSVSGTPADCTRIGITEIMKNDVDLVVSGINNGFNLGTDILYSGTVSAAAEASLFKIPAIAFSCDGNSESYKKCSKAAIELIEKLSLFEDKEELVLNVNFPSKINEKIKDNYNIRVSKMGERKYKNIYMETINDDGSRSLILKGTPIKSSEIDTDVFNIENGYITITPLHYDLTNFKILSKIEEYFI